MRTLTVDLDALRAQLAEQLAEAIGQPYQAQTILEALADDAELARDITPRELPGGQFGLILDEDLRARIRAALRA